MAERLLNSVPQFGGGGLELWLIRMIQQGALRDLPLYYPLGDRVGRQPEPYARTLLANLRQTCGDARALERTRDDGRAFRSWAESAPMSLDRLDHLRPVC